MALSHRARCLRCQESRGPQLRVKRPHRSRFHLCTRLKNEPAIASVGASDGARERARGEKENKNKTSRRGPADEAEEEHVKSTITALRHNKEQIAAVIVISTRATRPSGRLMAGRLSMGVRLAHSKCGMNIKPVTVVLKRQLRSRLLTAPEHEED